MNVKVSLIRPGKCDEGLILPIGILYIASYLRSHCKDVVIDILDPSLSDLSTNKIVERLIDIEPQIIGLSGLYVHQNQLIELATEIRRSNLKTLIVVGGPGVSSDYEEMLKHDCFDIGVLGEGEETFKEIVELYKKGEDLKNILGIAYKAHNGSIVKNAERELISNIDDIELPSYDLLNIDEYFTSHKRISQSPISISKRIFPILTSRGCPYRCIYCHSTLGKKFRPRSVDNVIKEISYIKEKYNIEELEIIDDIFNFDKKRAKEIFKKIIENKFNLKISFSNGIKYEMIDDEMLDLFKQAGVYRIAFGIESANKRIQSIIHKLVNIEEINDIINKSVARGFLVSGFFQIGIPSETKEEMLETIDFATKSKLHTATFHLTLPFPGTEIHNNYIKGKNLKGKIVNARQISFNLSQISDEQLTRVKRNASIKFYLNPKRMIDIYKVVPSKKQLVKNFINVASEILFGKWVL